MNVDTNKVIVLGGKIGEACEVIVDEEQLEYVSEFKYLGFE